MHRRAIQSIDHIRTGEDGLPRIEACFVKYDTIDSYRTKFKAACFSRNLQEREADGNMPNVRWQHMAGEPIGLIESVEERSDGLYGVFRLDADPAVPRAMQALYQLKSGTLKDVSVGFSGKSERGEDGIEEFRDVELNELSIVSQGAVPGAKVLAMRSGEPVIIEDGSMISAQVVASIVERLRNHEINMDEAYREVQEAAVGGDQVPDGPETTSEATEETAEPAATEPEATESETESDELVEVFPSDQEVEETPDLTDDDLTEEEVPEDDCERADAPDKSDVPGSNSAQLKRYWTKGAGLAKWRGAAHPWTTLYNHLRKFIKSDTVAKATASKWFIEVFGETAAEHAAKKKGRSADDVEITLDVDALLTRAHSRKGVWS